MYWEYFDLRYKNVVNNLFSIKCICKFQLIVIILAESSIN